MADQNVLPTDPLLTGLGNFTGNLNTANKGFSDFISQLNGLVSSVKKVNMSIGQNTVGMVNGLSDISNNIRYSTRTSTSYNQRMPSGRNVPDLGNLFSSNFSHPEFIKNLSVANGYINSNRQAPSSLSRAKDMLNPAAFMQDAVTFGVAFPIQSKIAAAIVKPVESISNSFKPIREFSHGFTGLDSAIEGFKSQLKSPFQLYEGIYQSKILLGSTLGGDKAANSALNAALKMARDYPLTTEQALGTLSKLSVYPNVKPYLSDEGFQRKMVETVSGLSLISPSQGIEGAMFSITKAMSGQWRSLQTRFNISGELIESLSGSSKEEMSSDPRKLIEGLHKFIGKAVGMDVLEKQKFTFTKQIDNFGDSLAILTKDIFETSGLYKTISGATIGFNAGFSSLSGNKEFLNYVSSVFRPYQSGVDSAVAKFTGIGLGAYKTMPMASIVEAMNANFKDMSMEEIGQKFETFIGDMGNV